MKWFICQGHHHHAFKFPAFNMHAFCKINRIGAVTAQMFNHRGAKVVIVGRNEERLKQVAERCGNGGITPLTIVADVGKDADAERVIEETVKQLGKIDVLVNNAGILLFGNILKGNLLKAFDETMRINMRAVVNLTILATPHLIKTKGCIINVSSIEGKKANMTGHLAYMSSKAALGHFTKGAALELAATGVRVNTINPGPTRSDILGNSDIPWTWDEIGKTLPLQRVSDPEETAELILYLASEKAKGITESDFVCNNGALLGTKFLK